MNFKIVVDTSQLEAAIRRCSRLVELGWISRATAVRIIESAQVIDVPDRFDVGHEMILPERARKDHR